MTLAQHLRAARVRAGMTRAQVCEFVGWQVSQLADLESERATGVHLKTLVTLSRCYGCSIDELTGYAPPATPLMNARELRAVSLLLSVMRAEL